jgi:hypothetical protein
MGLSITRSACTPQGFVMTIYRCLLATHVYWVCDANARESPQMMGRAGGGRVGRGGGRRPWGRLNSPWRPTQVCDGDVRVTTCVMVSLTG